MKLVPFVRAGSFVFLVLITGCGGQTAKVSGKVTLDGNPLPGGQIWFLPVSGKGTPAMGEINPDDGTYSVPNVPIGEVRITVDNRMLKEGQAKLPGGKTLDVKQENVKRPAGTYKKIPEHYAQADKSGLKATVPSGGLSGHDIQLKSK